MGEKDVTGNDRLLRDRGPAGEAENSTENTLIHLGTLGESGFLSVLGNHPVERFDVLQCASHECGIPDTLAVVAEHPHLRSGCGHGTQLGEVAASQAHSDRADRMNVNES